jgi:excisionase family DNA binding protein
MFPVALSPEALADALGIHPRRVRAAIKAGELAVYQLGAKRRILVADAVEWVRTCWKR